MNKGALYASMIQMNLSEKCNTLNFVLFAFMYYSDIPQYSLNCQLNEVTLRWISADHSSSCIDLEGEYQLYILCDLLNPF